MIIKAENQHYDEISSFCKDRILGAKVMCLLECYKFRYDFFYLMLYYNEETVLKAVISCFDGNITLVSDDDSDFDEITEYLWESYSYLLHLLRRLSYLILSDMRQKLHINSVIITEITI